MASVKVPSYISRNAKRGLQMLKQGHGGDGLKDKTVSEARDMAAGSVSEDKVRRMGPWLRRHEGDLDAPKNKDPKAPGYPGPGLVAWLLWGGDANGDMRAAEWAEAKAAQLDGDKEQAAMVDTMGKQKTAMTLEEINAQLTKEVEAAKVEASAISTKLSETEKLLVEATGIVSAFEALKADHAKVTASLEEAVAKIAALEAAAVPAHAQAAAIVASCGAEPATITPEVPAEAAAPIKASIVERWKALPEGSKERDAFFKANKQAIFTEMRNLSL